jgi:hypothetical protein
MTVLPKAPPDKPGDTPVENPWAFIPKAPSQQPNAQGPAQKPGEPLAVTFRELPPAPEPQAKKGKPEDTPGRGPDPDHKPGEGRGPPPKVSHSKK